MKEKYTLTVIRKSKIKTIEFYHLDVCVKLMNEYEAIEQKQRKAGLKSLRYMYITNEDGKILAEWISK